MTIGIISNYQDLQDNIADYLDRRDLVAQIPGFIQLCEASINRVLRTHAMISKSRTAGARTDINIPLPTNWLEGRNFEITTLKDNPNPLTKGLVDDRTYQATYQPPDVIDQLKSENIQFRPWDAAHYTFTGNVIEIYPDPGVEFYVTMEFYEKVGPLSVSVDVNHLLLSDPDIYLYGSLIHSAPFLRDDPRLMTWSKLYQEAVNTADAASKRAMTSGSRLTRKVNVRM